MDDAQFQSLIGLMQSSIWPMVVLALVCTFQTQIADALGNIASVKFPGGEVTFDRALREVEREISAEAAAAPASVASEPAEFTRDSDEFRQMLEISPAAAVIVKWAAVESALRELAKSRDISVARLPVQAVIEALRQRQAMSQRLVTILLDLRDLRNSAAHPTGKVITREMALRFGDAADEAIRLLGTKH